MGNRPRIYKNVLFANKIPYSNAEASSPLQHEGKHPLRQTGRDAFTKKQFKAMYLHRPQPYKIEGDTYYFDCSKSQAFQYFSRLGSSAMVLEPVELVEDLHRFFSFAEQKYRRIAKTSGSHGSGDETLSV